MIKFYGVTGPFGFLSNFHEATIEVEEDAYPTTEHYFQAMKTLDPDVRRGIQTASTPSLAKRLGKQCALRTDWDDVVGTEDLWAMFSDAHGIVVERLKDHLMYTALICKFTQHADLRTALLNTGSEELVEDAPRDYYWGCGETGTGQNKLGRMLMLIRSSTLKLTT